MNRYAVETSVLRVLRWLTIGFLLVITVFPFYYMVMLSFTPIDSLLQNPGRLLPEWSTVTTETYTNVLAPVEEEGQGFAQLMRNSAVVSLVTVALTLVVAIPGAYAVSRLAFKGRRQVGALFLSVYLFPSIVLAIPLVIAFAKLGLYQSLPGLMLVYVAQTVPVSIYMLRNYFETIPATIEEAATLDGANRFQTITKVVLPLAMPSIMSTGLYIFMIAWNEFLFALLFLAAKRDLWTVSLGLSQLSNGVEVPKTVLMAGSVLLTIPVIVLYGIAERWLTDGLTSGADKG